MARFGAFCFPGTGHINPMAALARRLQQRGHEVVIFGIADTEARIKAAGIEFSLIGASEYPLGTLQKLDQRLSELEGLNVFRFTVERVKNTAAMVLQDGPEAVRRANVDALLVDEAEMGGTVAEYLGLPFVSIAFFPPLVQDDRIPPFCFGWHAQRDWLSRLRNRMGFSLLSRVAAPIFALVNKQRRAWGLKPLKRSTDALSTIAQITQLPTALEFETKNPDSPVRYTGPFVDPGQRPKVDFDWERLDGRPLVYASLGTMQSGAEVIFRMIADACANLDVQLVLSLGGALDPKQLGALNGDPIVVGYAPQLEMVKRASAVITHSGLNTALESLAEGVPLVCIPLGNDQPGVAARVEARGAGLGVPRRKLNAARLRAALKEVLTNTQYRIAAGRVRDAMRNVDGLEQAACLIESAIGETTKREESDTADSTEVPRAEMLRDCPDLAV